MVLFQQGGSVNPGEMLQCISRQVFPLGKTNALQNKIYLSITHR
jgi:hypothetical protein